MIDWFKAIGLLLATLACTCMALCTLYALAVLIQRF